MDRNRQRKHIERVRVILVSAGGGPVQQIAREVGISRPMVWRWQQRFAEERVKEAALAVAGRALHI